MARQSSAVASKKPVATGLSSEQLSLLDRETKERSLYSARTTEMRYLREMQRVLEELSDGKIGEAEARKRLMAILDDFGYTPEHGFPGSDESHPASPGTITDLSSYGRLNLVIDTNAGMAASVARISEETDDTLDLFPAWKLVRFMRPNGEPRDWLLRWETAGNSVDWEGACRDEFIARKDSPIWQAIGDGAGGFTDTLGNPYPPFAFNSGMGWEDVDREEAKAAGLSLDAPVKIERPSLAIREDEIDAAEEHYGTEFTDDVYKSIILALSNEITNPCPVCHCQLRSDGGCTHCERTSLLGGSLKTISRTEAYKILEEPVEVKNGGTTFRFAKETLLSREGHLRRDHSPADYRRRVRLLLYGIDAAKTSKDVENKRASKPNTLGVYAQRKVISKSYKNKETGEPFKIYVIADDNGTVYDVFDLYPG